MQNKTVLFFLLTLCISLFNIGHVSSQSYKKQMDRKAIKSMAGCYDVSFKYTETFAPEVDYEKAYDYTSAAFEWATLVEDSENKIVLQHLLIIQRDTAPAYIIKHWRQDWVYEASERMDFHKDNHWKYKPLVPADVTGTWTQSVYQVDDSPRYSGTATWTHVDGQSSWFHKADSPLPRREYSKRSDYNVMKRGNRVQIKPDGWLHEQDNDKVVRTDTADVLLVQEKGYNYYKRRPDTDCKAAMDYWKKNKAMWSEVRDVWTEVFDRKKDLKLAGKIDKKRLYEHLFFTDKQWTRPELETLIQKYVK